MGQLIVAQQLYRERLNAIPEFTFYKALERMVQRRKLLRVTKGIYLRGGMHTDAAEIRQEIIRYYTAESGRYCAGVQCGGWLLQKYGLLQEDMPEQQTPELRIYTSRITEQKRMVAGVELRNLPCRLDKLQCAHLEALEILTYYEEEENQKYIPKERLQDYLKAFAEQYDDRIMVDLLKKKPYPKHTIAFMRQVLIQQGVENRLGEFLAGTSRYRIPKLVG
ncbi:MAG: hypothetical protein IJY09_08415 [Lachnospiraceae bacterium]|nr:hypothetical protein [Lachnospiraceae bacterium]